MLARPLLGPVQRFRARFFLFFAPDPDVELGRLFFFFFFGRRLLLLPLLPSENVALRVRGPKELHHRRRVAEKSSPSAVGNGRSDVHGASEARSFCILERSPLQLDAKSTRFSCLE